MNIKNLVGYFRDCYKEDTADFNLRNLRRLDKEDLLFIQTADEVASRQLPRQAIDPDFAISTAKRIEIYQRERVLLHGCFFITGKLPNNGDSLTLFSPLVINEAKIESDEYGYYFSMDTDAATVNEELLSLLFPDNATLPELDERRYYNPIYWSTLLEKSPFDIHLLEVLEFPQLVDAGAITLAQKRKKPTLLSASALAFVERSVSSRGILHELTQIQEHASHSSPLTTLLGERENHSRKVDVNHRLVPALLTSTQRHILEMAASSTLSAVSGPPGTGKSYTIAAVAAEHFTRGESVLIVAGSETALDVIAQKLCDDFGLSNLYVRAGQKAFLQKFKHYLSELLAGYHSDTDARLTTALKQDVETSIHKIKRLERTLLKLCDSATKLGVRTHSVENGTARIWARIRHRFSRRAIENLNQLWHLQTRFNQYLQIKENQSKRYLRAQRSEIISNLLAKDRQAVQTLNRAIRTRTSAKQIDYFGSVNFQTLLGGFPVWLVSLNTLHKVLPHNTEMFDLLIIDEATQCNISSTLPAFERAKRALVVGDQKQLKHFSFLARHKEKAFSRKNSVENSNVAASFRDNSMLDFVHQRLTTQGQVAFLDEHFRSQPELIYFSNQQFYAQKLKVMQHRPCSTSGHLKIVRVNGERHAAGHNIQEADAVLAQIQCILKADQQSGIATSIGVLSPFSKQVKFLTGLIERNISLDDIKKHKIRIATPYGFQGEERDTMLLSFCVDNNSLRAAAYLNRDDVFNVAITRARSSQYNYLSIDEKNLSNQNLLKQYLAASNNFSLAHCNTSVLDKFQQQVIDALQAHSIECWPGYKMLGTSIDILAKGRGEYLAIDLIGHPGPWSNYFELNTYKVIIRAGIEVMPLSYAQWFQDTERCIQALLLKLAENATISV